MVGCFSLCEDHCHTRVPADLLVERWPRLDIWQLLQIGALTEGVTSALAIEGTGGDARPNHTLKICCQGPNVTIDGTRVALAWDSPMEGIDRPWWSCPLCSARCRFVYLRGGTIGCRKCFRLDYSSRHLRRQTPGVGRVERLRRRLGDCEVRPFAPLPARIRRGRSRAYHDKLVARILDEEAKLLGHLQGVTRDLSRRIRVRKERGKW